MYVPRHLAINDDAAIDALISDYGFGLLISPDMNITRLPLICDNSSKQRIIYGHMARANQQHKELDGQRVSAVFNGPHSYISPTWYKQTPAVSTWNYASVQCFGTFSQLNSTDTLVAIKRLVNKYEPSITNNESLMPNDYIQKLLKAVVGFKITVDEIHAVEKLGQQKSVQAQKGVFEALLQSESNESVALAEYMQKRRLGIGIE